MPGHRLVLCPREPGAVVERAALVEALQRIGLLGEPFAFAGDEHWRPGDAFLSLVTFLGCSPVVSLGEPGATGEDFCHVAVTHPFAAPTLRCGRNVKVPRCRACKARIESWQAALEAWRSAPADHRTRCSACAAESAPPDLDWRGCAGFGRVFVDIHGVFEGEAVPGQLLLDTLRSVGGGEWSYFYLQE